MFGMQFPSYASAKLRRLSCFRRNFRNMLNPFQVVSNSNSKVFGGQPVPMFVDAASNSSAILWSPQYDMLFSPWYDKSLIELSLI